MRQPKPYWKKSHQAFYANINGKPVRLAVDEKEAFERYHQLMAGQLDIGPDPMFLELCADFLAYIKPRVAERTHEFYKEPLEEFYKFIGTMRVSKLKPYHVERWVAKKYPNTNNGSTIRNTIRPIQRVLNWARKSGRIARSPLEGMEVPAESVRDIDITPKQFKQVLKAIKDEPFRDFVTILRETGCRVKEARLVEAKHFDRDNRCWTFPVVESKGKRDNRVVLLNDKAFAITKRWADRFPKGPIFRNMHHTPWDKDLLGHRCRRLQKKLGFRLTPGIIRHVFATDAIERGVDIITIAALMGHKSLKMLQRVYSKVHKRSDHLRRALVKATQSTSPARSQNGRNDSQQNGKTSPARHARS